VTQATTTGPFLKYSGQFQRWQGEDDTIFIWMDDATFQTYVQGYLAVRGITEPTLQERSDAVQHCRARSYWDGVHDPGKVHIRYVRERGK